MASRTNGNGVDHDPEHTLKVQTTYFDKKLQPLKVTRGRWPATCMDRAFMHMRRDDYGAHTCDIFNAETGKHYGNVVWPTGARQPEITFKDDPRSGDKPEEQLEAERDHTKKKVRATTTRRASASTT